MTIVEKAQKIETKPVALKLPVELTQRLDRYCAFVSRERSEVVALLLDYALRQDGEFAASEGIAPVRRRRTRATEANGAGSQ